MSGERGAERGAEQRIVIETGMGRDPQGTDPQGGDATRAAIRAVDDAMRRSSLPVFGSIGMDHGEMRVQVTLGAHDPAAIDIARITAHMPRGRAEVTAVTGGLSPGDGIVVVTAAVEVFLPVQAGRWRLSEG